MAAKQLCNEKIRDLNVFVVDDDGSKLGVMKTKDAILYANNKDLDLVVFVPGINGKPSICKVLDYGKFQYQKDLKQKQNKKNQVNVKLKEVKVRPQVGMHDLEWKANQANDWLKQGNQVKFKIMTYGRVSTKSELIIETYNKFIELLGENGKVSTELKKVSPVMYEATFIKK